MFSARADLVVLHVIVKESDGVYVAGLPADAFTVLEDGRPQAIQFFAAEDAPVTVGLVIDSSGSMYAARSLVAAAAAAFVETSHPLDDIFALAFNERTRAVLPPEAPFTGDAETIRAGLMKTIVPYGRTALHDAVVAGLAYLQRGRYERKVLVLISDGGDNASAAPFEEVEKQIQTSNAVIYTIAVVDPVASGVNPRRLRRLAAASGGESFEPKRIGDVAAALGDIARDIRSAYTIGYAPVRTGEDGRLRRLRVLARNGQRALAVRTRQGYSLGEE